MSQDLSNYIREVWAPDVQDLAVNRLVAKQICEFNYQLPDGNKFHRPYHGDLSVGSYTRNPSSSGASVTDISTTDEYLEVNQCKYAGFYVDRLDEKQMYVALEGKMKRRAIYKLRDTIDAAIFAEYSNAGLDVDYADVDNTKADGQPIALTTSNILDVLETAKYKLEENGAYDEDDLFLACDPKHYYTVVEKYMASNGYKVQDDALKNGYRGRVLNFEVYVSNNIQTSTISSTTTYHWLAGKKGAITLIIQQEPKVEVQDLPQNTDGTTKLGTNYFIWTLYGKKTFTDGARELVDILIAD